MRRSVQKVNWESVSGWGSVLPLQRRQSFDSKSGPSSPRLNTKSHLEMAILVRTPVQVLLFNCLVTYEDGFLAKGCRLVGRAKSCLIIDMRMTQL
jgi:hypothetical protein